jgi:hypothetical protein
MRVVDAVSIFRIAIGGGLARQSVFELVPALCEENTSKQTPKPGSDQNQ